MPYTLSDSDIKSLLALCEKLHAEGKAQKTKKVLEFLRSQMKVKKAKGELEKLRKAKEEETKAKEAERALKLREVRGKTDMRKVGKFLLAIAKMKREKKRKAEERRKMEEMVARAKAKAQEAVPPAKKLEPEPKKEGAEPKPPAPKREIVYTGLNWLKEPQFLEKVKDVANSARWKQEGEKFVTTIDWDDITSFADHPKYTKDEDEKVERYFNQLKPKIKEALFIPIYNPRNYTIGKYFETAKGGGQMVISPDGDVSVELTKKMYEDRWSTRSGYSDPAWVHWLQDRIDHLKGKIKEARK